MNQYNTQNMTIDSILLADAKESIDGIIQVAEDTLHRDMEFDRRKLRFITRSLIEISQILETVGDRVEILEQREL